MTSVERMTALINAVTYVVENDIPGDITECGVWRGGSMMTIALTLLAHGDRSRALYLYDTFEGMSAPTADDKSLAGISADELLKKDRPGTGIWCYASLDDVRANLLSTGYPEDRIHLIHQGQGRGYDSADAAVGLCDSACFYLSVMQRGPARHAGRLVSIARCRWRSDHMRRSLPGLM